MAICYKCSTFPILPELVCVHKQRKNRKSDATLSKRNDFHGATGRHYSQFHTSTTSVLYRMSFDARFLSQAMHDIPSKFIVSSRLADLDNESIRKIIRQTLATVHEPSLQEHMRSKPQTSLLAIGISNPEELRMVIAQDIPVIHIQKNCQALQAVQKHHWGTRVYTRKALKLLISGLWGIFGVGIKKLRFKRGRDNVDVPVFNGNVPLPNLLLAGGISCIGFLLFLYTKKTMKNNRKDYHIVNQEEFILVRDDVQRSSAKYMIQSILPYTVIGLGLYYRKR